MRLKVKLYHKILLGLFLGAITGVIIGPDITLIKPVGDIYLRLIQMLIVPLVLLSIISGVTSLTDLSKLKRVGIKAFIFYTFTTISAVTIGLILAQLINPGTGLKLAVGKQVAEMNELPSWQETFLNIVPTNPFSAFVEGNMLQIIFFAMLFGIGLVLLGKKGIPLKKVIDGSTEVMFKVTDIVMAFTPYGVFALIAVTTGNYGLAVVKPLLKFVFTEYLAIAIHILVTYNLILILIAKVNPLTFFRKIIEPWIVAFSTATSSGTLPVSMKTATEKLGVSKSTSSFMMPLGATVNMDGTSIYFGVVVMFVSQVYGLPVSLEQQALLVLTATLLSIGTAGVPQAGLVISIALLNSLGLPLEAISLIAGIYRILDQVHTSTNVTGDLVGAVTVSALEGDLDRNVFNNKDSLS